MVSIQEKEELLSLIKDYEIDQKCNPLKYYEPVSPKHTEAHKSNAGITALFGGNKSGKSTWLIAQALRAAYNEDPYREWPVPNSGRIIATDFEHGVEEALIPIILNYCKRDINGRPLLRFNKNARGQINEIILHNKSKIEFMTHKQEPMLHESVNRHWIGFDEPPPLPIFNASKGRIMEHKGKMWFAMTLVGEPWIIENIYEQSSYTGNIFCQSVSVYDRVDLSNKEKNDMVANMSIGLTEDEKLVRIYGDIPKFGGRVYSMYKNESPWIVEPFKIPDDWQIIESIDPHDGKPTAVVWLAVDYKEQCMYVIDCLYDSSIRTVKEVCEAIIKKRQSGLFKFTNSSYTISDPSINSGGRLAGVNFKNEFASNGVYIRDIRKPEVDASIQKVAGLLRLDKDNKPRLMVFSDVHRVRYEFMHYFRNPEDMSIRKMNDDCMDCIRYAVCCAPVGCQPTIIKRWSDYKEVDDFDNDEVPKPKFAYMR